MNLLALQNRVFRRLNVAEFHLNEYLQRSALPPTNNQELYELEGWLSELWQIWCRFCRQMVFFSCRGCETAGGTTLTATHISPEIISFIASKQNKGTPPSKPGTNSIYRYEPTWGHIDKLIDVISALSPQNKNVLLSGFGTVQSVEHIRLIRNATAHRNLQTLADVQAIQPYYLASQLRHPLQALFWVDRTTGRSLAHSRIDDMRIAARNASI